MKPTAVLPEDAAIPGLVAIRASGLAAVLPALHLDAGRLEIVVRAYRPGRRVALEVRGAGWHFAVKAYAEDPMQEVALGEALAAAGLAGNRGTRVPPLIAWERDLRLLVIGWLEGPTAFDLIEQGQGERAGPLAAAWLKRTEKLVLQVGKRRGAEKELRRSPRWIAALAAADPRLGSAAAALGEVLVRTQPREDVLRLVHGTFHDLNIIDLGDGTGVIDWERCGLGPPELDAGMFLACLTWRGGHEEWREEVVRAQQAFEARIAGRMDPRAVTWHEAAALLCRASRQVRRPHRNAKARAQAMVDAATRLATAA